MYERLEFLLLKDLFHAVFYLVFKSLMKLPLRFRKVYSYIDQDSDILFYFE